MALCWAFCWALTLSLSLRIVAGRSQAAENRRPRGPGVLQRAAPGQQTRLASRWAPQAWQIRAMDRQQPGKPANL